MSEKILSKKEIIEDTFKFYSEDVSRRSIDTGCMYNASNGNHCAFARFVSDEDKSRLCEGLSAASNMHLLKPEYEPYGSVFWCDIQKLHDNSLFWNKKGATEKGIAYKDELLKKYSN